MILSYRVTVTAVLMYDRFRCDGCGAETREFISPSPSSFAPAPLWIHRRYSRLHFCCQECAGAFEDTRRERHNARRRQKRAEAAREPLACENCGEPFTPRRSDARYCSTRCRVAAHRAISRSR